MKKSALFSPIRASYVDKGLDIELRLREYESYLKKGDSIALGNMYLEDAEIIPSTIGSDNITKAFGSMKWNCCL